MIPKKFSSEAIVLARKNFSEADRILVVYTKSYGKMSLIAKGVRKPKSRKRGSLEVFSNIKFSASRGKSMDIMTEVEIINNFNNLRKDLKMSTVAYFLVETISRLTRDGVKNTELYAHIFENIGKLDKGNYGNLKDFRKSFISKSLEILGFWPKGKSLNNPDQLLESIIEREMSSKRVGKIVLS